ncbi:protein-disulfide reductase DsbD domain-containing protein [Mesorhizobium sp. CAU 1741]|uniref:protein-disulfide reductase DsbD domain-containing protein n=1 Tax=Mesorhizobium sp. CAU 1741 TaxID=3140366 RepID=UPI00325BFA5A
MIYRRTLPAALLLAALGCAPAQAASSDWYHVEGGAVRLVTSGRADADGRLRGALEIHLKPGWKTYWVDPGSSGVPPTLDVSAAGQPVPVEIAFPAPQRFDDGYGEWAGYDHSVALALTFRLPDGQDAAAALEADAFLGVCETICIPVQAKLSIEAQATKDESAHEAIVAAAFGALPGPARHGFEARSIDAEGETLTIEATVPDGAEALDIHVAGTSKYTFGSPARSVEDGKTFFALPYQGKAALPAGARFHYTLVTSTGSVSGLLELP